MINWSPTWNAAVLKATLHVLSLTQCGARKVPTSAIAREEKDGPILALKKFRTYRNSTSPSPMQTLFAPAVGLACALLAPPAHASTVGRIEVQLAVATGCEISGANGQINDFGRLDFGVTGPTWRHALTVRLTNGESSIFVECSPDIDGFSVVIDGGLRGDRTLAHDTADDLIDYEIFRDAAHNTEYVANVPQAFAVGHQPVEIPVFGAIAPNHVAKPSGLYLDTLLVTIDF